MRRRFLDWVIGRLERDQHVPNLLFLIALFCPATEEQEDRVRRAAGG